MAFKQKELHWVKKDITAALQRVWSLVKTKCDSCKQLSRPATNTSDRKRNCGECVIWARCLYFQFNFRLKMRWNTRFEISSFHLLMCEYLKPYLIKRAGPKGWDTTNGRVSGGERNISRFPRDYPQTTAYANRKMSACHMTYGGVPGLTEFITANMLDRLISMITQILTLELSPNIHNKLIQPWF